MDAAGLWGVMSEGKTIPALDRGLRILDLIVMSGRVWKYTEFRSVFPDVAEASLNRLLKSLVSSGHLCKGVDGSYGAGEVVRNWQDSFLETATFAETVRTHVTRLRDQAGESAAFGMLRNGRIDIIFGCNCPESVTVMQKGGVLHFESDHAGALAIMSQLDQKTRDECFCSQYSKISLPEELEEGLKEFGCDGVFADRSRVRVGVSRMAVPVLSNEMIGALFICLPTAKMEQDFKRLSTCLKKVGGELVNALA